MPLAEQINLQNSTRYIIIKIWQPNALRLS